MGVRTFLKKKISKFNIFFCFLTNSVVVNRHSVWTRYALPQNVFYSISSSAQSNTIVLKFLTKANHFWALFWKIITLNNSLSAGFFVEMELIGLGFRIRKIISTVYRFFWGYANYVYLFIPKTILVEYSADERVVFFFSLDSQLINNFATYLMLLKKLSKYRVTGFVKPGKVIRLNAGKQR